MLKKKKKGCSGKDLQKNKGFKSGMKERVGDEQEAQLSPRDRAMRHVN